MLRGDESLRFSNPSVVSVIFAPRPQNYTLSSTTTNVRFADAIAVERLIDPKALLAHRVFESFQRWSKAELRVLVSEYLQEYLETSFTATTLRLPSEIALSSRQAAVPTRTFPASAHFNLLQLPEVEGMLFDTDDFDER